MAKVKEEELKAQLDAANARIEELEAAAETPDTGPSAEDQYLRELALRLLWQAHRMPKSATQREITITLPKFRDWVGTQRAEELEHQWRKGSA